MEIVILTSKKQLWIDMGKRNVTVEVLFWLPGHFYYDFIPEGKTVNKYTDIIRPLRDAVRRKRPEKWRTNSWFLPHNNVPAHRSVLVKDFLAEKNMSILENQTCFPDVAAADFYLFPPLKSALKWRGFCDATDFIKNATEELKRLSQNGFQECSHHLYGRWQTCVVARGNVT